MFLAPLLLSLLSAFPGGGGRVRLGPAAACTWTCIASVGQTASPLLLHCHHHRPTHAALRGRAVGCKVFGFAWSDLWDALFCQAKPAFYATQPAASFLLALFPCQKRVVCLTSRQFLRRGGRQSQDRRCIPFLLHLTVRLGRGARCRFLKGCLHRALALECLQEWCLHNYSFEIAFVFQE
jgi:hypothetical protein